MMLEAGRAGRLTHFPVADDRAGAVADSVAATVRANYPSLKVPFHSRWRHFVVRGRDRWSGLFAPLKDDPLERARARFDLAVTSVLLDAGAGPDWRWRDA